MSVNDYFTIVYMRFELCPSYLRSHSHTKQKIYIPYITTIIIIIITLSFAKFNLIFYYFKI